MNEFELFDELTFIDDDLILEAHETPVRHIRFGGVRKAAVLIAAVITVVALSLTAVAGDWEITPVALYEKYASNENICYLWHSRGMCYGIRDEELELDDSTYKMVYSHVCTTTEAQTYIVCEGAELLVRLEAMILMPDDRMEFKSVRAEGKDSVQLELDHMVDGEAGILVHVRTLVFIPNTPVKEHYSHYLPQALGFEIPVGTDARFPDMKHDNNYDGRNSAVEQP